MKLGDRFYRAMSEWRCARFRNRHLATEENAYGFIGLIALIIFMHMGWISRPIATRHTSDRFHMSLSTTETFGNFQNYLIMRRTLRLCLKGANEDKAKQLLVDHYEAKLKKVNRRRDKLLAILAELK